MGVSLAAACSAGDRPSGEAPVEQAGSVTQAITAACNLDTIGLPCDPDGPAGAKLECQGVCAIATSGLVQCRDVATGTLDGVICGTASGVGDNACKRYCSGKTCLAANAPEGAACRPNSNSSPCDGQCDGAGKCDNLGGSACTFGRQEQLCKFDTCNFANASQCITKNLLRNTLCSDADACSISRCDSGVCTPGGAVGCDDGNACTDDSCDPQDGGCVGVNDDTNACSDGNACFTGEHCSNGTCVPGATPVDCDDDDPCTDDSCDPNIGCANVPKSCSDGNACTQDVCDPATGACSNPAAPACDDGDACTVDSCDSVTGCAFTALDCDDDDACTDDACSAGSCTHDLKTCDDSDACTQDTCAAATGCANAPIVGCGAGGEGGAGGEPATGNAGAPADGGEPNGAAGAPEGGAPVVPGAGGDGPSAGGTAGSTSAGSTQGGSAPGGSTSSGGNQGGSLGAEGGVVSGGSSNDSLGNSSSCGCRAIGGQKGGSSAVALLLGAMLVAVRRRRGERLSA